MERCSECATDKEWWSYCVLCFSGCQNCAMQARDTIPAPPPDALQDSGAA